MSRPKTQHLSETASWSGDLWGGVAAMLVALPSSIAFGVLVYTALDVIARLGEAISVVHVISKCF